MNAFCEVSVCQSLLSTKRRMSLLIFLHLYMILSQTSSLSGFVDLWDTNQFALSYDEMTLAALTFQLLTWNLSTPISKTANSHFARGNEGLVLASYVPNTDLIHVVWLLAACDIPSLKLLFNYVSKTVLVAH